MKRTLTITDQAQYPRPHMRSSLRKAFTLIELLVVMGIIGLLASMIMAFVTIGQRSSDTNDTKVMINKVGIALDQFATETGSVPLPTGSKADQESGTWYPVQDNGEWDKQQLAWRLGTEMTQDDKSAMLKAMEDAVEAVGPYNIKQEKYYDTRANQKTLIINNLGNIAATYGSGYSDDWFKRMYNPGTSNTLWSVSANDYWFNSNVGGTTYKKFDVCGLGFYKAKFIEFKSVIAEDQARRTFLTMSILELDEEFINGQTLIDAWGNPLIYAAQSYPATPGARFDSGWPLMTVPSQGRDSMTDRNEDGTINRADWAVAPDESPTQPNEDYDGSGGTPNEADYKFHYDRDGDSNATARDWGSILYAALPGHENSYFLASAGADGLFNILIDESVNDDNLNLIEDYND